MNNIICSTNRMGLGAYVCDSLLALFCCYCSNCSGIAVRFFRLV